MMDVEAELSEDTDLDNEAHEAPKSAPRGPQEAILRAPTGGRKLQLPSLLIDGIQDCPRRASRAAKRAPREPKERAKRPQDGSTMAQEAS